MFSQCFTASKVGFFLTVCESFVIGLSWLYVIIYVGTWYIFSFFSVASYLKELLADSGIVLEKKCAIVQTAYANGSSTEYITNTLVSEFL